MGNASINRFEWLKAVTQAEDLIPVAKVIATALSIQFANVETGQLNPLMSTLAGYVKVSVRTAKRAIKALADGWAERKAGGGVIPPQIPYVHRVKSSRFPPKRKVSPVTF